MHSRVWAGYMLGFAPLSSLVLDSVSNISHSYGDVNVYASVNLFTWLHQ